MTENRSDWVTFLSDYGLDDVFVGVCKGVIASIAPRVQILDICHQVAPQDVRQGATVLATAIRYLPTAVHLALVDPPAAKATRRIAVEAADGSLLVGPDNGLLSLAWTKLGGAQRAVEVTNGAYWLDTQPTTFHGRDIYAPVVAHLASGVAMDEIGE